MNISLSIYLFLYIIFCILLLIPKKLRRIDQIGNIDVFFPPPPLLRGLVLLVQDPHRVRGLEPDQLVQNSRVDLLNGHALAEILYSCTQRVICRFECMEYHLVDKIEL